MRKRRLRPYVLPIVYVVGITALFVTILFVGSRATTKDSNKDYSLVTSIFTKSVVPVINLENKTISKPYNSDKVEISKYFYDKNADDTKKEASIIYYENTYMQNTGILYSSDEEFDVIASLPGTVSDIKDDDILGKVVYIEYNNNVVLVYYSLGNTDLKIGDSVEQNMVIGKSGTNKLENEKKYSLLMEVYINGKLVNPLDFFEKNPEEFDN